MTTETTTLKSLLREPLVHFALAGLILFGLDHAINAPADNAKVIDVSKEVQDEARAIFKSSLNRNPSPAEMKTLIERWVDNEVLYREGVALALDRGDSSIRERIIFKALSITQSGIAVPPVTEAELKAWFEKSRARYDTPTRYTFLEAAVTGSADDKALQAFADSLNGKGKSDLESSLRVFKERPRSNLLTSYGEGFTKALESAAPGVWTILKSGDRPLVMQLERITPGTNADFNAMKDFVIKDQRDETQSRMTTESVRQMAKKYTVRIADPADAEKTTKTTSTS